MFESKKDDWVYFSINIVYIIIGIIAVSITGFISQHIGYVIAGLLFLYSILKIIQFIVSAEYKLGYYKSVINFIIAFCVALLCLVTADVIYIVLPFIIGIMAFLSGVVGMYISVINGYMKSEWLFSLFDSICFVIYGIILLFFNSPLVVDIVLFGVFMIVRGLINAIYIGVNLIKTKKIQNK
ncbi:MAG: DUF308 domain-containing protein [Clostridia bacterium]